MEISVTNRWSGKFVGRLYRDKYRLLNPGMTVTINTEVTKIFALHRYCTFYDAEKSLQIKLSEDYRKMYNEGEETRYGVIIIELA